MFVRVPSIDGTAYRHLLPSYVQYLPPSFPSSSTGIVARFFCPHAVVIVTCVVETTKVNGLVVLKKNKILHARCHYHHPNSPAIVPLPSLSGRKVQVFQSSPTKVLVSCVWSIPISTSTLPGIPSLRPRPIMGGTAFRGMLTLIWVWIQTQETNTSVGRVRIMLLSLLRVVVKIFLRILTITRGWWWCFSCGYQYRYQYRFE